MAVKLLAFCKSHILRIKQGRAKAFTKQKTHPNGTFSAGYGDAHVTQHPGGWGRKTESSRSAWVIYWCFNVKKRKKYVCSYNYDQICNVLGGSSRQGFRMGSIRWSCHQLLEVFSKLKWVIERTVSIITFVIERIAFAICSKYSDFRDTEQLWTWIQQEPP